MLSFLLATLWGSLCVLADEPLYTNIDDFNTLIDESDGSVPVQTFKSTDIIAPVWNVIQWNKDQTDPGYIFIGVRFPDGRAGPMIFDSEDLSLVYADLRYESVFSSNVQYLNGTPYLTFWEGQHHRGHANGSALLFNENYDLVYEVSAKSMPGALVCFADFHEVKATPDANVIVTAFFRVEDRDLTSIGGPASSSLLDSGFQEIDPVTNEAIFKWAASDHFSLDHSFAHNDQGQVDLDFAHTNSVEKTDDGNYLVSSRHMSLITLVNGTTGEPIWVLGGKYNQFEDLSDGEATNFGWQHDARFYKNQSHITLFDNHQQDITDFCDNTEAKPCYTRVLHLEIDTDRMTVRVVNAFYHPENINSMAMGSVQMLDNGNVLSGWGKNPSFVEYSADGSVAMAVQRGRLGNDKLDLPIYRVHKGAWKGKPRTIPSIAAAGLNKDSTNATVYASWNGATEVNRWVVVGTNDPFRSIDMNDIIVDSPRDGFETNMDLGSDHEASRYVAAVALDHDGAVLGSSDFIDMIDKDTDSIQPELQSMYEQSSDAFIQENEPAGWWTAPSWWWAAPFFAGGFSFLLTAWVGMAAYRWWQSRPRSGRLSADYAEVRQADEEPRGDLEFNKEPLP